MDQRWEHLKLEAGINNENVSAHITILVFDIGYTWGQNVGSESSGDDSSRGEKS